MGDNTPFIPPIDTPNRRSPVRAPVATEFTSPYMSPQQHSWGHLGPQSGPSPFIPPGVVLTPAIPSGGIPPESSSGAMPGHFPSGLGRPQPANVYQPAMEPPQPGNVYMSAGNAPAWQMPPGTPWAAVAAAGGPPQMNTPFIPPTPHYGGYPGAAPATSTPYGQYPFPFTFTPAGPYATPAPGGFAMPPYGTPAPGFGGAPPGTTPWSMNMPMPPMGMTPGGGGGGGIPPAQNPQMVRDWIAAHDERLTSVGHFAAGEHYGPVLTPLLVSRLGVKLKINPLIEPPSDGDPATSNPYLIWDMRFPLGTCRRSVGEKRHRAWHKGRDEPATFPRVSSLRLVMRGMLETCSVDASQAHIGVTCGDVMDAIARFMHLFTTKDRVKHLPQERQQKLFAQYRLNRKVGPDSPGAHLPEGVTICDWLVEKSMFGGIVEDPMATYESIGAYMSCVFMLCHEAPFADLLDPADALAGTTAPPSPMASSAGRSPRARSRRPSMSSRRSTSVAPPHDEC